MENDPKPYSKEWFLQELVKAVFIAVSMLILGIGATGLLQAYLLPDRMEKESEKLQAKFDAQIKIVEDAAIRRESGLIKQLQDLQQQYSDAIMRLKVSESKPEIAIRPENPKLEIPRTDEERKKFWEAFEKQYRELDPEKERLRYIEKYSNRQHQN